MANLGRNEFYKIAGVKQHVEFDQYLKDILFKQDERNHEAIQCERCAQVMNDLGEEYDGGM